MKPIRTAFTLIEIIVAVTIFSMIMISVMTIYMNSSRLSIESDMNRMLQENIKSSVDRISEDIRENGVLWVVNTIPDTNCSGGSESEWFYKKWNKLCTPMHQYYLASENLSGDWIRRDSDYCEELKNNCAIVLKTLWDVKGPITNNMVSIQSLEFEYSNQPVDKVTMKVTFQPAIQKWLQADIAKNMLIKFQTTVSQRPF